MAVRYSRQKGMTLQLTACRHKMDNFSGSAQPCTLPVWSLPPAPAGGGLCFLSFNTRIAYVSGLPRRPREGGEACAAPSVQQTYGLWRGYTPPPARSAYHPLATAHLLPEGKNCAAHYDHSRQHSAHRATQAHTIRLRLLPSLAPSLAASPSARRHDTTGVDAHYALRAASLPPRLQSARTA